MLFQEQVLMKLKTRFKSICFMSIKTCSLKWVPLYATLCCKPQVHIITQTDCLVSISNQASCQVSTTIGDISCWVSYEQLHPGAEPLARNWRVHGQPYMCWTGQLNLLLLHLPCPNYHQDLVSHHHISPTEVTKTTPPAPLLPLQPSTSSSSSMNPEEVCT